MKRINAVITLLALTCFCQNSLGQEAKATKIGPQQITAISSMQFYTTFVLIRTMLEGDWNDKVFQQFSYYDGMNLKAMKDYETEMADDKIWGEFLRQKNSIHQKVYEELKPLFSKKRANEGLTKEDLLKLESLDKLIYEKLIK